MPEGLPRLPFHLTARPWKPLGVDRERYLDVIEGLCRFTIRHQDARGAVVDPILKREHQYSTPYFAFAVGTLLKSGRARDLLDHGVAAMDHATECFARGNPGIPDAHGEFFLASLPAAVSLYAGLVPQEKVALWRRRLGTPRDGLIGKNTNNWRTYAMRGEWLRLELGLVDRESATAFIEQSWLLATQRDRIAGDAWNLYQDRGPFPESHAVESVGRGNLLGLIEAGYDGESQPEIRRCVERGTAVTLLLQDPSGQCAPNGRTDDHVFNDVLYQLAFDVMAEAHWPLRGPRTCRSVPPRGDVELQQHRALEADRCPLGRVLTPLGLIFAFNAFKVTNRWINWRTERLCEGRQYIADDPTF